MATGVSAQMWGQPASWRVPWLRVRTVSTAPGEFTVQVNGGVPQAELDSLGLATIGSGTFYNGYQSFTGGADWDPVMQGYLTYLLYPPSTIDSSMVWPNDPRMFYRWYTYYCGCADTPQSDTVYTADGFGYWRSIRWDPDTTFHFKGYILRETQAHKCMAAPCPIGGPGPMIPKNYICFTDSMYVPLPDDAIPCGQSRIYILANVYACDSVYAVLSIPGHDPERVRLERISQYSDIFTGSYINSVSLGLKSFNQVTLEADAYPPPAANELVKADKMNVVLPIITSPPNDTLVIDHDLMKLAEDIVVDLKIINDNTGGLVNVRPWIFSAGYRLRSKWVANENRENDDTTYTRICPADSSYKYCQWPNVWPSVPWKVTFPKDSVPAIGGALTVEAKGLVFYNVNMDPHYEVNSDSLTPLGAAVPRYHIVIDEDPSNAEFIAELGSDIIRAMAWVEHAGGAQLYYPHYTVFPQYNHYWEDATKVPCENRNSTATGIMQIIRTQWDSTFSGIKYNSVSGFDTCNWDSLAWNWKINIHNGKFIYFIDNFDKMNSKQDTWDSICTQCSEKDSLPDSTNREDLSLFGYKNGATQMGEVTAKNWTSKMSSPKGEYVRRVRGSKYAKPWNN